MDKIVSLDEVITIASNSKQSLVSAGQSTGLGVRIYLHWSAGHYDTVYEDYHINITGNGAIHITADDFSEVKSHTYMRNTGSIGVSLCCAHGATSNDLGEEPPTEAQLNTMGAVVRGLCDALGLEVNKINVMTHGEAGDNEDGASPHSPYGPKNGCERWDLEFLGNSASPSYNPNATDGSRGGDVLRKLAGQSMTNYDPSKISNDIGEKIAQVAATYLGRPYEDSECYMCTGLVNCSYQGAGIDLSGAIGNGWAYAPTMYEWCKANGYLFTNFSEAIAGDIAFMRDEDNECGHVGIYIGNSQVIHNAGSKKGVVQSEMNEYYWLGPDSMGYARPYKGVPIGTSSSKVNSGSGSKALSALQRSNSIEGSYGSSGNRTIWLNPKDKTFCEPVYPDYIYVTDNIPGCSLESSLNNTTAKTATTLSDLTYIVTSSQVETLTGLNTASFNSGDAYNKRQTLYDPNTNRYSIKTPNAGKPLNNNDPFPVDSKIEELENHSKRIKQQKISLGKPNGNEITLAKHILQTADAAEKRCTRLENILSTTLRYLFAIGSRVSINCVYYGGQDRFSKYKCIRCMHDDRINDGQVMQIDQCLSCTRYEPIIGQVYDILNETGSNLAAIHDDIQMSYMSMDDYVRATRTEEFTKELEKTTIPTTGLTTQDPNLKSFKDGIWANDKGITMDWKTVPVEEQKPQINWRQNIDDNENPKRLNSYQGIAANINANRNGLGMSLAAGAFQDFFLNNDAMMSQGSGEIKSVYEAAKNEMAGKIDNTIANMNAQGWEVTLKTIAKEKNVDPLLFFAIFSLESSGDVNVGNGLGLGQVNKEAQSGYTPECQISDAIDTFISKMDLADNNRLLAIQCYNCAPENLKEFANIGEVYNEDYYELIKDNNFYGYGAVTDVRIPYFPRICAAYITASQNVNCSSIVDSRDSSYKFQFPIDESYWDKTFFLRDFGTIQEDGVTIAHTGLDLKTTEKVPVKSMANGRIVDCGHDESNGNYVNIQHENQTTGEVYICKYMHLDEVNTSKTKEVAAGERIGTTGKTGKDISTIHLHWQIEIGGKPVDPKKYFDKLDTIVGQKDKSLKEIYKI